MGRRFKSVQRLKSCRLAPAGFPLGRGKEQSAHGVSMINNNFERKVQFGGWSKREYKEIRTKLRRMYEKEDIASVVQEQYFDLQNRRSRCDS